MMNERKIISAILALLFCTGISQGQANSKCVTETIPRKSMQEVVNYHK